MKKFWLVVAGIIAGITALSTLGAILGLGISGLLVIAGAHFYLKSSTTFLKVFWAIIGIVGLLSAVSNIPGLLGIIAIGALYYIVKKWKQLENQSSISQVDSNDPFVNFEKQWNDLYK